MGKASVQTLAGSLYERQSSTSASFPGLQAFNKRINRMLFLAYSISFLFFFIYIPSAILSKIGFLPDLYCNLR